MSCFLCGNPDAVVACVGDDAAACEEKLANWKPTGIVQALGGDGVSRDELPFIAKGILQLSSSLGDSPVDLS